jgi:hypothetical protein
MGRMSPGILAGIEAFPRDWVGVLEIFSALAKMDGVGWLADLEVSGCCVNFGVAVALGLDVLSGLADIAG